MDLRVQLSYIQILSEQFKSNDLSKCCCKIFTDVEINELSKSGFLNLPEFNHIKLEEYPKLRERLEKHNEIEREKNEIEIKKRKRIEIEHEIERERIRKSIRRTMNECLIQTPEEFLNSELYKKIKEYYGHIFEYELHSNFPLTMSYIYNRLMDKIYIYE